MSHLRSTRTLGPEYPSAASLPRGSGSADVPHDILDAAPQFTTLYGHSKGALVIASAIADLDKAKSKRLSITAFGCAIGEGKPPMRYEQFLDLIDSLGTLNSWGDPPERSPFATHGTNTQIPLSMDVRALSRSGPPLSS
jgi:hypothetical protein